MKTSQLLLSMPKCIADFLKLLTLIRAPPNVIKGYLMLLQYFAIKTSRFMNPVMKNLFSRPNLCTIVVELLGHAAPEVGVEAVRA